MLKGFTFSISEILFIELLTTNPIICMQLGLLPEPDRQFKFILQIQNLGLLIVLKLCLKHIFL